MDLVLLSKVLKKFSNKWMIEKYPEKRNGVSEKLIAEGVALVVIPTWPGQTLLAYLAGENVVGVTRRQELRDLLVIG